MTSKVDHLRILSGIRQSDKVDLAFVVWRRLPTSNGETFFELLGLAQPESALSPSVFGRFPWAVMTPGRAGLADGRASCWLARSVSSAST